MILFCKVLPDRVCGYWVRIFAVTYTSDHVHVLNGCVKKWGDLDLFQHFGMTISFVRVKRLSPRPATLQVINVKC